LPHEDIPVIRNAQIQGIDQRHYCWVSDAVPIQLIK